jgi:pimeloyl-ACP methyl ester carboxylesterase
MPPGVPLALIDAVSPREVPFASSALRALRAKNRPDIDAESRAYKAWLDTIPGARLIVTRDSGHNVPIEQPQLVVETIRGVVRRIPHP